MQPNTTRVLVVEADDRERERLGAGLEHAGFEVLTCPGPTAPDYTCVGSRSGTCPLASEDPVVVLDTELDSEATMLGTPAEDLLGLYLRTGHRVVALEARPGEPVPGRLLRLRRHPEIRELVAEVRGLASHRPEPGSGRFREDRP